MAGITRRELVLGLVALPLAACESGKHEPVRFDAGPSGGLPARDWVERTLAKTGMPVFVRRSGGGLRALSAACTCVPADGRCPVRWIATTRRFICPCHGTVYRADGTVEAGPAREPLRSREAVAEDGRILVGLEARGSRVDPSLQR